MSKLLRAGFHRYTHSLLFWICMFICIGTGVFFGFQTSNGDFDETYYRFLLFLNASLFSLIIGREFTEGMFRIKIAAGHSKGQIFLAEAILALAVTFLMYMIHTAIILMFNIKLFVYIDIKALPLVFIGVLLTTLAFTALFVFISCLISKRSIASVFCILLVIALYSANLTISKALSEPKTNEYMVRTELENGEYIWTPLSRPNPRYVDEPVRGVLEWVENISPFGQFSFCGDIFEPMFMLPYITETNRPYGTDIYDEFLKTGVYTPKADALQALRPLPIYQIGLIFVLLGSGYIIFRKKDFK